MVCVLCYGLLPLSHVTIAGISFKVPQDEDQLVHGTLYIDVSDLPASRKAAGLRGVTSSDFTCSFCHQSFDSLVSPECFDSTGMYIPKLDDAIHTHMLPMPVPAFHMHNDW